MALCPTSPRSPGGTPHTPPCTRPLSPRSARALVSRADQLEARCAKLTAARARAEAAAHRLKQQLETERRTDCVEAARAQGRAEGRAEAQAEAEAALREGLAGTEAAHATECGRLRAQLGELEGALADRELRLARLDRRAAEREREHAAQLERLAGAEAAAAAELEWRESQAADQAAASEAFVLLERRSARLEKRLAASELELQEERSRAGQMASLTALQQTAIKQLERHSRPVAVGAPFRLAGLLIVRWCKFKAGRLAAVVAALRTGARDRLSQLARLRVALADEKAERARHERTSAVLLESWLIQLQSSERVPWGMLELPGTKPEDERFQPPNTHRGKPDCKLDPVRATKLDLKHCKLMD